MPLIQVTMIEGRSAEAKTALMRGLTNAAADATGAPRESIRVIYEVPALHWAVGGVSKTPVSKESVSG